MIKHINGLIAYDALEPGHFAKQQMLINGVSYKPPKPSVKTAKQLLKKYLNANESVSMQAIDIMIQYDRHQFFWDGSKRTAWLATNYHLLQHGAGVLNIDTNQAPIWNHLLTKFYNIGKISRVKARLNNNCITC